MLDIGCLYIGIAIQLGSHKFCHSFSGLPILHLFVFFTFCIDYKLFKIQFLFIYDLKLKFSRCRQQNLTNNRRLGNP